MQKTDEKKRLENLEVIITSVSGPAKIAQVAEIQKLNPQEVFVRVNFKYDGEEYKASNKLRILGENGYNRLLEAQRNQTPIKVSLVMSKETDDAFIYVDPDKTVTVSELFSKPVEKVDTRKSIANLFNSIK